MFAHDLWNEKYATYGQFVGFHRFTELGYSVDFIFLSFGIMGFIVELWNY